MESFAIAAIIAVAALLLGLWLGYRLGNSSGKIAFEARTEELRDQVKEARVTREENITAAQPVAPDALARLAQRLWTKQPH